MPTLPPAREFRSLLQLALPIVVVQVGLMLMGVVDTLMVGRVSAAALAAVALGNLYFFGIAIFGMGVLFALDPLISQAVGARDGVAVARGVQRGLVLAVALAALSLLPLLVVEPVITLLRQPPDVIPLAAGYVHAATGGLPAFLAFVVLRQTLQAMDRVRPIVVAILGANVVNAFLNWALVFGHLGMPALGPIGTGWASTISRWTMLIALVLLTAERLGPYLRPAGREVLRLRPLVRMIRLGLPIGAQLQLEMGAFAAVALLMGWLGTAQMAGHQIAINLASLTFMVPVGIAQAASVRVGQAVGRGDPGAARMAVKASLVAGASFMAFTALLFLTMPGPLTALYTDEGQVARIAIALIPVAGVFQVFDGLQVVAAGVLRGIGDTTAPFVANLLAFWLIGIPISLWLGFRTPAGPVGLWWGLVAGLAAAAIFLVARVRVRMRRDLRRIIIDDDVSADAGALA
ncbi:MAG TPA: MATE family efflux transporter [Longimicrobiales bacterium]|nr:MATE family efflux transporter [Longimicrobiales bacterium]